MSKKMKRLSRGPVAVLSAVCMILSALSVGAVTVSADGTPSNVVETVISDNDRTYPWLATETVTRVYDFSSSDIKTYSEDKTLSTASLRTNMVFDNGVLSCKEGKTFSFGTAGFLGDDYGLYGGTVGFDLSYTGGTLSLGIRLELKATDPSHVGIWFSFTEAGLTVSEPVSGFSVAAGSFPATAHIVLEDKADSLVLSADGTVLLSVSYNQWNGELKVFDARGKRLGAVSSTGVNPSGYLTLYADGFGGSIDNLSYTHTSVTDTTVYSGDHAVDYASWVATDDRGRTTPVNTGDGTVKSDKQVGMFYFLSLEGTSSETVTDITAYYLKNGLDSLNNYLADAKGGFHWAEPYFGYYRNVDTWVFRQHAYMLEAMGVDFIFLDFTNGVCYPEGLTALCDTWIQMRHEGLETPCIVPFGGGNIDNDFATIRSILYSEEGMAKYGELLYYYEGKPLILCDTPKNEEFRSFVEQNLTVRHCWAWQDADGWWSWLQEYKISKDGQPVYLNGGPGRNDKGELEALALCVGHHPTTSKGRSYANGVFPNVNDDYGFSLDSGAGTGLASQYEAIRMLDPKIMLVTGWNEWTAGLNHNGETRYAGTLMKRSTNQFYMVDTFNTEYSRDAEPMRIRQGEAEVGFGDNYYYQLVSVIRDFKGMNRVPEAVGQGTVDITDPASFADVGPEYRDTVGDTAFRSEQGYFNGIFYVNNTGRNDFETAKVSQDDNYLYFTVSCCHDIEIDDASNWMNLFINLDGDSQTGWEGYDFVLNRGRDGFYVSVESLRDGWTGTPVGRALYTVSGKNMTVRVSKSLLGASGSLSGFLFKWADNSTVSGNVMEFSDLGDTAPNGRFAYLYVGGSGHTESVAYELIDRDGHTVPQTDESTPLPVSEPETDPEDTPTDGPASESPSGGTDEPLTDGTGDMPTDTADESAAGGTGESQTDATEGSVTVYRYSTRLKIVIVLTGAVLGVCAFLLITTLSGKKKKQ